MSFFNKSALLPNAIIMSTEAKKDIIGSVSIPIGTNGIKITKNEINRIEFKLLVVIILCIL